MKGISVGIRIAAQALLWCVLAPVVPCIDGASASHAAAGRPEHVDAPEHCERTDRARGDAERPARAAVDDGSSAGPSAGPSDGPSDEARASSGAQAPREQSGGAGGQAPAPEVDELDELAAMLSRPGPDGRTERESAVTRLMAMPRLQAHRLLHERLQREDDPDQLRLTILRALQGHLLLPPASQFGGAGDELRPQLLTGYLAACAPLWANASDVEDDTTAPVRAAARRALQRVPARELDAVASALMGSLAPTARAQVLRCLADMQQTLLAATIARQLEAPEAVVRAAAQKALQLLVYPDDMIRTKAEFDAWQAEFGSRSYVDLVQRAARTGPRAFQQLREQMETMRVQAAREFVEVHVQRGGDIDWAAVQGRTTAGGPAVLDACLDALQKALSTTAVVGGAAAPRQAFFRALLDRFAQVPDSQQPDVLRRRSLLLEVAAYLVRPEEAELAGEIRTLLLAELASPSASNQISALRGIRRFPTEQARQVLVERARELFVDATSNQRQIQVILDTLKSRTEPRWVAPSADAVDKSAWVSLVDQCCRSAPERDLRDRGLLLSQTLDASNRYVPEAFEVLRALSADSKLDPKFRATCLIYLDAWRAEEALAERWVQALHASLDDAAAGLRKQAAKSLARLREATDKRRAEWLEQTVAVLRDKLLAEPDASVLDALVDCMQELGREPGMPEPAITALKSVLGQLGDPIPKAQEFRVDPLLRALTTIAADRNAGGGQWLAACDPLLAFGKRKGLRLVLQAHRAHELTRDVSSEDAGLADRARRAARFLIGAAALQPARTEWGSEANKEEARRVRAAFLALDAADAAQQLDAPRHRVLRLSVDQAADKHQEVVQRAMGWLGQPDPDDPAYRDRVRLLAARSQLALEQPKAALELLDGRSSDAAADPEALAIGSAAARALAPTEPAVAAPVFERVMRATSTEDPRFRERLLDWMASRSADPEAKAQVLEEAAKHAAMFEAADCPAKLRERFEQLRAKK